MFQLFPTSLNYIYILKKQPWSFYVAVFLWPKKIYFALIGKSEFLHFLSNVFAGLQLVIILLIKINL
jgi:hypothetical protein